MATRTPNHQRSSALAGTTPRSTRNEILAAGEEVFAELGYDGATVRDIALRLGISKGNLTYHFATKDDLLFEIIHDAHLKFVALGRTWLHREGSPEEVLRQAFCEHVELVCTNVNAVRIYIEDVRRLSTERQAALVTNRDEYERIFRRLIARYQPDQGSATSRQNLLRTVAVFGLLSWTYQWYSPDDGLTPQDVGAFVSEMAIRSLDAKFVMPAGKKSGSRQ